MTNGLQEAVWPSSSLVVAPMQFCIVVRKLAIHFNLDLQAARGPYNGCWWGRPGNDVELIGCSGGACQTSANFVGDWRPSFRI